MKRLSKLAAILAALVLACAFFGCSNGSSSADDNSSPATETESKSKVLYWDSSRNSFVGTASWTANTISDKVLLGYEGDAWGLDFIDSVVWTIRAPEGVDEYTWEAVVSRNGTYSINQSSYTLIANFESSDSAVVKWAQIPNVSVTVTLKFDTGKSVVIATQKEYDYSVDISEKYIDTSHFIYNYEPNKGIGTEVQLMYRALGGEDNSLKVKSAIAYTYSEDNGGGTVTSYTATTDWTDTAWLGSYTSSNSNKESKFTPSLYKSEIESGRLRFIITFLGGEQYDTGLVYWRTN